MPDTVSDGISIFGPPPKKPPPPPPQAVTLVLLAADGEELARYQIVPPIRPARHPRWQFELIGRQAFASRLP